MVSKISKPLIFLDADVIFAGSASRTQHGASLVVLRLGELTLLDCITSEQAVVEVERNLAAKLPSKLPEFRLLVSRCLRVVSDPELNDLPPWFGQADPKELPLLVTAVREGCSHLLTFNTRHYFPRGDVIKIQRPGKFLLSIRMLLSEIKI